MLGLLATLQHLSFDIICPLDDIFRYFRVYFQYMKNSFLLAWSILSNWSRHRYAEHIVKHSHQFLLALIYVTGYLFLCLLITYFGYFIKYNILSILFSVIYSSHVAFSNLSFLKYIFRCVVMFTIGIFLSVIFFSVGISLSNTEGIFFFKHEFGSGYS